MAQTFSCKFCEISKNTFFTEHLRATASEMPLRKQANENGFSKKESSDVLTYQAKTINFIMFSYSMRGFLST